MFTLNGCGLVAVFPEASKYFGASQSPLMINYRVANLDYVLVQLRKEGVQVDEKVQDESYGKFGWATDPEGNRFELWEPK
jgi:predicted enzyme related to lactoylglutathione lyase